VVADFSVNNCQTLGVGYMPFDHKFYRRSSPSFRLDRRSAALQDLNVKTLYLFCVLLALPVLNKK
jgi:hypothetical protein